MSFDLYPVLLALAAALLFSTGAQFLNIGLSSVNPRTGTAIAMAASAVVYVVISVFYVELDYFFHSATILFFAAGLLGPAISANCAAIAIRYLGPTLSSTLSSTSPLFGILLGVLWLGEVLTWEAAVGTGAIVAAIFVLMKPGGVARNWPLWALSMPITAAAIRAATQVVTKVGMEDLPAPIYAAMISGIASLLGALLIAKFTGSPFKVNWRERAPYWFVGAGITFGIGVICVNFALLWGKVIIVIPVVSSTPIFSMLLSIFIFRRESITWRTVVAIALVVPAVAFIAVSR